LNCQKYDYGNVPTVSAKNLVNLETGLDPELVGLRHATTKQLGLQTYLLKIDSRVNGWQGIKCTVSKPISDGYG